MYLTFGLSDLHLVLSISVHVL